MAVKGKAPGRSAAKPRVDAEATSPFDIRRDQRMASARNTIGERPSARPLYLQVKDHLIRRVLAGDWGPGGMLPSEMKLAEEYGLSQGTVRHAIEEMAVEGLVTRQSGRGTFVASHKGDYKPFRFSRFFLASGETLAGSEVRYLASSNIKATARVAAGLQLAAGEPVSRLVRARCHRGAPVLVDFMYLGEELCPDADTVIFQQRPNSLYLALEQVYNLLVVRVDERIRARLINREEARLLDAPGDVPVLEVERTAYSLGGEPVEWRISVCRTDQLVYLNRTT
ncbi:GntR family transcriptional regulator [Pinirhizobacter sp.]|uniref:GntR family transcriptional regulator n=1 Tax=Pinirhizobacter sp. TaxID=2950432 RepID=UPI002F3FB277